MQYSMMGELKQISILSLKSCQQLLGAWYVTLQIKLNEEKLKHGGCLSKMVLAQHFCKFAEAGERHSKHTNLTNLPLSLPNLLSFRKKKGSELTVIGDQLNR